RRVRTEVESLLTRSRDRGYHNLDEAVYRFYAARLENVSAVAELVDLVRERKAADPRFLEMTAADLQGDEAPVPDAAAFPASLPLDNRALPLNYAYRPGGQEDGVTLEVNVREAAALTPAALDWAVPGHLEAKVEHYLRTLPKELRRAFVPLATTAQRVAQQLAQRDRLTGRRETLTAALAAQLRETHRVAVEPALWADKPLPDYLRVRVRVLDDNGRELAASRELPEIQAALEHHRRTASAALAREEPVAWRRARAQWEKPEQEEWTFGEVPAQVQVAEQAGVPVLAYPGLVAQPLGVGLRLFKTATEAQTATREGLAALLGQKLRYDLGWLERDLKALRELGPLTATLVPVRELQVHALQSVRAWVCDPGRVRALTAAAFATAVAGAKADLRGLVPRLADLLREILELRQALLVHPQPYEGLERDVARLLPADFLAVTPHPQLAHLPRYLKAMRLRADRWRQNPAKDAERARQLAPYLPAAARPDAGRLRWLVEEFRVSLFAQELGTAEPVSPVKLDRLLAEATGRAAPASVPPPVRPLTAPAAKTAPVKSLGALDRLFKK
ncbi:MAG: DUF3418 domain-containing protein, partial [Opitutaceae bacterium]|nr:DUF3418 domain-containing protein [Opitutaceae bacterium]